MLRRRHKRQAVDLVFLIAYINTLAIAFEAVIVRTASNLACPDAGDVFFIAAFDGRLAKRIARRIVQVADGDGHRMAFSIRIVSTFHDVAAFDSCHFHNGTSVIRV